MSEITAGLVKQLREKTGAGMMDCKKALTESSGDIEKAVELLRKKGLKDLGKRAGKVAAEGSIISYLHTGNKIGVILELNSETDFVAKSDDFQNLGRKIAMHIAWANPKWVSREEVPEEIIAKEKEILMAQLDPSKLAMAEKILPGKFQKFYEENCLLDQIDALDAENKHSIQDLVNQVSAKLGEKVLLRRFSRFEVGDGIEKQKVDYAKEVAEAMDVSKK